MHFGASLSKSLKGTPAFRDTWPYNSLGCAMPVNRLKRTDTTLMVAMQDRAQASMLRALAISVGAHANELVSDEGLDAELTRLRYAQHARPVLVTDLATLAGEGAAPARMIADLQSRHPALGIVAVASDVLLLSPAQEVYLKHHGALGAFGALSVQRTKESLLPVLACVLGMQSADLAESDVEPYLKVLGQEQDLRTVLDPAHAALAKLPGRGLSLRELVESLKGPKGFDVRDRSYRLKSYPECLVANEGVNVLQALTESSRGSAVALGQALQHAGFLHHVTGDHLFADEQLFFRFTPPTENVDRADLVSLVAAFAGTEGVGRAERTHLGRRYPDCFVGRDAADWLRKNAKLNRCEALRVGQSLLDLRVFRHVTNDHPFADWDYFYRFGTV